MLRVAVGRRDLNVRDVEPGLIRGLPVGAIFIVVSADTKSL